MLDNSSKILVLGVIFLLTCGVRGDGFTILETCEDVCLGIEDGEVCDASCEAQQGIAVTSTGSFVTSRGSLFVNSRLFKYLSVKTIDGCTGALGEWMQIADVDINYPGSLCHVGDITVHDGLVYAPMSEFDLTSAATEGTLCTDCIFCTCFGKDYQLARFNANNLQHISHRDVTFLDSQYGIGDLAGLDWLGQDMYVVEWQDNPSDAAHIFVFDGWLDPNPEAFEISTLFANGIACKDDLLFISWGESGGEGRIDVYSATLLPNQLNQPLVTYSYDSGQPGTPGDHAEGLTFDGDDLWVCAAAGHRVRRIETPSILFGACCLQDDTCNQVTMNVCIKLGGDFQGVGTSCNDINICRPEDINSDGTVDVLDLIQVILAWGPCPAPPADCPQDVNSDGTVNVLDLIQVILAWG